MQTFCIKCQPPLPPLLPPPPSLLCWTLKWNTPCAWAVTEWTLPAWIRNCPETQVSHWEYVTVEHVEYGSAHDGKISAAEIFQRACQRLHQQGLGCLLEGCEGEAAVGWVGIRCGWRLFSWKKAVYARLQKCFGESVLCNSAWWRKLILGKGGIVKIIRLFPVEMLCRRWIKSKCSGLQNNWTLESSRKVLN